jgi:hypothetical protein
LSDKTAFYEDFIKESAPPSEPFDVVTSKGKILVFTPVASVLDIDDLEGEATKFARAVKAKKVPAAIDYAGLPLMAIRQAHKLGATMVGLRVPKEGQEGLELVEERWDRIRWLRIAKEAGTVFTGIVTEFDLALEGFKSKAEDTIIENLAGN